MSLTIKDVHVVHQPKHGGDTGFWRPATLDDLVEVAESMGGTVENRCKDHPCKWCGTSSVAVGAGCCVEPLSGDPVRGDPEVSDLRNLHEAIEHLDDVVWPEDTPYTTTVKVRAAVRLVASLLETCPTCKGTRYEPIPDEPEFDVDVECKDCSGTGLQVSRQAIERGAAAGWPQMYGPGREVIPEAITEAVLGALLLGDTP